MGILNLNKLFDRCQREVLGKKYNIIIIDGSNIIFQTLCSELSKLKKSGLMINQWGSVNSNLLTQISHITHFSIESIKSTISKYFERGADEIILVLDPLTSPKYTINTSYTYNHNFEDILDPELKTGIDIDFEIKSEEQEKRRALANKASTKADYINEIQTFEELSQSQRDILTAIFTQSYTFNENRELLKLGRYVIMEVYRSFSNDGQNLKVINADDEADLVIKNVASTYTDDEKILILSMDTDYNILFSDNPNVDTCSLMNRTIIYNPFSCWKALFNGSETFDYDHILRLAPLFGNDYTVKLSLLNATNFEDALKLFEGRIGELRRGSLVKKITKFAKSIPRELIDLTEPLPLDRLDEMLHSFDDHYFKKYFLSNVIYTNWKKYNHYSVMPVPSEADCLNELESLLIRFTPFKSADGEDEANNGITFKFYIWDGESIFDDWEKFFLTVKEFEIKRPDMLIDYYYEHEYHDEAVDFL